MPSHVFRKNADKKAWALAGRFLLELHEGPGPKRGVDKLRYDENAAI